MSLTKCSQWGAEGAEIALDIVLDKRDVVGVRIVSFDVHHAELENTRQEEVVALQASCEINQQEAATVRSELADQAHEVVAREVTHKARVADLETNIAASDVRASQVGQ